MNPDKETVPETKSDTGPSDASTTPLESKPLVEPELETKLPITKKPEDVPSEKPAVTPVDVNLPIVTPKKSPIKLILIIVVVLALLGAIGFGLYSVMRSNQNTATNSPSSSTNSAQLKAAVTLMDGKAMYSKDGTAWVDLTTDVTLAQGDFVQTQVDSRVMLTVDDGSVVRMNASTMIELEQLTPNNIVITNLAGDVYTRVAKSDNRTFTVLVDDTEYKALGTAYKTMNSDDEKGVQVYESTVEAGKDGVKVAEGKQFFEKHKDAKKVKNVTTVPVDELTSDGFVLWNLEQDKKEKEFKDKLGYLKKIEEKKAANKQEGEKPKPVNDDTPGSTSTISLSGSPYSKGAHLTWTVNSVSGNDGFKVVRSKDDSTPTYGQNEAQFVGAESREHKWQDGSGKTFYYRVCVYKAGNCSNYSNTVQVKSPVVTVVSGPVNLTNPSGSTINWTFGGTAPYGFKIVADTSDNEPNYPDHSKAYVDKHVSSFNLSDKLSAGSWYVRVCKYTHDYKCMNYSNMVQVTVP